MSKKAQKGGFSISKTGKIEDAIKKGKTEADKLNKFKLMMQNLDPPNYDNNKAMWTAIKHSRPIHLKIIEEFSGANASAVQTYKPKTGSHFKVTVLQYALIVADLDTVKAVLNLSNEDGFKLNHLNQYKSELLLALERSDAHDTLKTLFFHKSKSTDKIKYSFYDPDNRALVAALNISAATAELIINNVYRDYISLNTYAVRIFEAFIKTYNKDVDKYKDLLRKLIHGAQRTQEHVARPPMNVNATTALVGQVQSLVFLALDHPPLLEVLLSNRADPNGRISGEGDTIMHIALQKYKKNRDAAKPLLRLLKQYRARGLQNLKTGKFPDDILTLSEKEDFREAWRNNFS